jgi:hypothetical protein
LFQPNDFIGGIGKSQFLIDKFGFHSIKSGQEQRLLHIIPQKNSE